MKICKNFFSGFCLNNECELFEEYLEKNDFTISGFSYGAIKAFEYVLNTNLRVDKLQLLSPLFFKDLKKEYKNLQVINFKEDNLAYVDNFLKNVQYSSKKNIVKYQKVGTQNELKEFLSYTWNKDKFKKIINNGTKIEVYLGQNDKIIDSLKAKDFFKEFSTVYYFKNKGHLL